MYGIENSILDSVSPANDTLLLFDLMNFCKVFFPAMADIKTKY